MGLIGLLTGIDQSGFVQGTMNYLGNNTKMGQDINAIGSGFQQATGQPQQQLIGQPAQQSSGSPSPQITDEHLHPANEQGIRMFNDAGKQYLNNIWNTPPNT